MRFVKEKRAVRVERSRVKRRVKSEKEDRSGCRRNPNSLLLVLLLRSLRGFIFVHTDKHSFGSMIGLS
jgi:hypothetical protein